MPQTEIATNAETANIMLENGMAQGDVIETDSGEVLRIAELSTDHVTVEPVAADLDR